MSELRKLIALKLLDKSRPTLDGKRFLSKELMPFALRNAP